MASQSFEHQLSPLRTNLVLMTLFLGTFTLGTAELLVVGVLNVIAQDLDVSVSAAGTLVTLYALGLAVGGPVLTGLTIRFGRRHVLIGAVSLYLGITLAVTFTGFAVLVAGRVIAGSLHGLVVAVSFTLATSIVSPERAGRAISAVLGGFAVSAAIGVPVGTFVGQSVGWRNSFLIVAGLGFAVLILILALAPAVPAASVGLHAQMRHALAPRVLAVLGLAMIVFVGQYSALTYIAPFLEVRTGVPGEYIGVFVLAYGAATAVGAFVGGYLADRSAGRTIVVGNSALVVAIGALALGGAVPVLVAVTLVVWGVAGIGMVPSIQHRVVSLAGPGAALAAGLPASAINLGIAGGSLTGGWALSGWGITAPAALGVIVCAAALPLAIAAIVLTGRPPAELASTNAGGRVVR